MFNKQPGLVGDRGIRAVKRIVPDCKSFLRVKQETSSGESRAQEDWKTPRKSDKSHGEKPRLSLVVNDTLGINSMNLGQRVQLGAATGAILNRLWSTVYEVRGSR